MKKEIEKIKIRSSRLMLINYEPSLKELYEYKCSCGKKIIQHEEVLKCSSTTMSWDIAKEIYDLGTCQVPEGYIMISRPNGFGKFRSNTITKK